MIIEQLAQEIKGKKIKIAFSEGDDPRIIEAAMRGAKEDLFVPLLLGGSSPYAISWDKYHESALSALVAARNGKNSPEECAKFLNGRNYQATMLVAQGIADGALGGATYSTADTIRPALQIIKTAPGIKSVSSSFIMLPKGQGSPLVMGDCAVIIDPTAEVLADIAIATAETAVTFGLDPKVALLSFSTKGSANAPQTQKVAGAVAILKEKQVSFEFDGELQFDAAFVSRVGEKKAPGSKVAGHANTFIFPSLEAGNIGYKIAQYLGNFEAVGPILQGLNAPINDLSRGCDAEEVYKMAIITAAQALKRKIKK